MRIENLKTCSGCHACYSICPKFAISMKKNSEGFLYPSIDNNKCIKCFKCEAICPVLNLVVKEYEETKAFAVINKDEEIRLESSSGGVFSLLAEKIIAEGGIVFGARFADDFSVIHSFTDDVKALFAFRGSKYLQSSIGDCYKKCKSFLDNGKIVLFSGSPCQIVGLKKYLNKDYDNLFTVDFICHGVPSPVLWKKYLGYRERKSKAKIENVFFRDKKCGWKLFSLSIKFEDGEDYTVSLKKDPYMQLFLKNVCLRDSCYDCKCKSVKRISDITLADFWGIKNVLSEFDDDKGTSFVIVHSSKGKQILEFLLNKMQIKEINLLDGIRYNQSIYKSVKRPLLRNRFYNDLNKYPFEKIIKKYAETKIIERLYKVVRRCLGKIKRIIMGNKK